MNLSSKLHIGSALCLSLLLSSCGAYAWNDHIPLPDTQSRPTPLHFGLYVTPDPAQNPIDPPERFVGFHAATDFEIFPGEEETAVPVRALCDGNVLNSGPAEGYGGLVIQACVLDGMDVTVIYGHLSLEELPEVGTTLLRGNLISTLGMERSEESGFNRKHLHLGIHKGTSVNPAGYVQTEAELDNYLDPQDFL